MRADSRCRDSNMHGCGHPGRTLVAVLAALMTACASGRTDIGLPEGASTPDEAVDVFMKGAQEANQARDAGRLSEAERAYDRMAGVFGTERGSMRRSFSTEEVRDRMIVLAGCLRPSAYRIASSGELRERAEGRAVITVDLQRNTGMQTLPFRLIRGREDRWFIERIELGGFTC